MSVGAIGNVVEQAQRLIDEGPANLEKFEEVLQQLEQNPEAAQAATGGIQGVSPTSSPQSVSPDSRVEEIRTEKLKIAESPGGLRQLGNELHSGYERLNEIVGELKSGRTYSPHELLGIQGEMHDITMRIEVTTKVVSEVTAGLKQLMQQQV